MPVDEGRLDDWQLYVEGRKEAIWARWSVYAALEEEQLDKWQLYVEGRERAYGFLGEEMVCLCCVGRGIA
jgi:hypothetical protein